MLKFGGLKFKKHTIFHCFDTPNVFTTRQIQQIYEITTRADNDDSRNESDVENYRRLVVRSACFEKNTRHINIVLC